MRILLLSIALPLLLVTGCLAEQSVISLDATPEGLTGKTSGEDPYLTLTGLDIPAYALQCVEIEMCTDGVDEWQLFWSNSSSGEYQGFLPDAHTPFVSREGNFHTYRIFPFWHAMGRIVQLRLDHPQRRPSTFTIKSIKIVQTASIHTPPGQPLVDVHKRRRGLACGRGCRGPGEYCRVASLSGVAAVASSGAEG